VANAKPQAVEGILIAQLRDDVAQPVVTTMAAAGGFIDRWAVVRAALAAATLVAAGLVLASAWALLRPHLFVRRWWSLASVGGAPVLWLSGATPVRVLLALAIWGALTPPSSTSPSSAGERA
jgi:chromate transport protein ChrA